MKKSIVTLTLLICHIFLLNAQNEKFGKINKSEFEGNFYDKDSTASAVVLYKDRNTQYNFNSLTGWSLITTVYERVKIFSTEGFKYATQKVKLYDGGENEKFSIKAYTYNLENGKIVKTKLEHKDVYELRLSDNWKTKNFSMPNIQEGSIIEWKYTINSPYVWSIDDMVCQYDIPIVHMESSVQIPEDFVFNTYPSMYYPINLKKERVQKNYSDFSTSRSTSTTYTAKTTTNYKNVVLNENKYTVVASHVPALLSEPYVNNIDNYRAKVQFEISAYIPPTGVTKTFNLTWEDVTTTIYDNPNFGRQLKISRHFKEDLESATMGLDGSEEKISAIFDLVKSKMTWDKSNNKYVGEKGIVRAYKEGVGNAAEINLTLVAMLRESGINANPILVSTRSHGIPLFPTKSGFNYVIAGVEMNDEIILLDATEKFSQPSLLPLRDLNWRGRLVRENGSSISVNLYPNTYNMKILKLNASIDAFGALEGTVVTNYHGLNSIYYRNLYQSKNEEDVIEFMQNEHQDIDIEKIRLTNKDNTEKPFTEMFRFSKETGADVIGDKIYISPLLFLSMSENPFKLEERLYPVDFGSPWKNNISISLVIPQGYRIESKPDDIHLTLPNNMGEYLLKTEVQNNKILVQTQTVLNVPIVSPEHYQSLKDLFMKAMAHQQEKVILIQEGT